jgi:hypothetical protein
VPWSFGSVQVLSILEDTAKSMKGTYPDLLWNKVDGDASEENAAEFKSVCAWSGFGAR